jgi:UV DNA damage repair endonuclease
MKITMENDRTKYTSKELLDIFKEQQRLCLTLDSKSHEIELNENTLVYEWRDAQDLLPWEELSEFSNKAFK